MSRHLVRRAAEAVFELPEVYAGRSEGFTRWTCVDHRVDGAIHTGFGVCELAPGGRIGRHVHSCELSVFVLEGSVVIDQADGARQLVEGDYGMVPVGVAHAWRNSGSARARWAEMLAPQPRPRHGGDTYFLPDLPGSEPMPIDVRDPRTRSFGHIDPANMDVDQQTQDRLAVSASMRTALLVYSGITVKMMVDTDLGAQLSTMFMVQYVPAGFAGPHDHPFEETYMILEGETDAIFDGHEYRLGPGDVAFAGVGALHQFSNVGPGVVRWLETQAPQPPARHSYRFARDWRYLTGLLEAADDGIVPAPTSTDGSDLARQKGIYSDTDT
jgi:quercetin dioxygenase-like cupin family protein